MSSADISIPHVLQQDQAYPAMYPLLGVLYLVENIRLLGPRFLRSLLISFITTLAILVPLSALTFKFQRRLVLFVLRLILSSFTHFVPAAKSLSFLGYGMPTWSAIILTMGESSFLVALVMGEVFKKEKSKGLFDAVLQHKNVHMGPLATVTHHHEQRPQGARNNRKSRMSDDEQDQDTIHVASTDAVGSQKDAKNRKRDRARSASSSFGRRILLWFVTLPLNFVPVVGPLVFCYINAKARVQDVHRRYFDLKEMTVDQRKDWVKARETDYKMFAFVSQALELIPVLGIFFGFTNSIGAALWASDLERDQDILRHKKQVEDATTLKK
ncbi:hypothetical protein EDD11_010434 [Mortierella claussenii]|nr:hypothetical protein EDD11_010434 [Mortierella claussenii]